MRTIEKLGYDDHLEKILSAVFGVIGILAILLNLGIKGLTCENVLDAVKDVAGLVVTIAVFLIARKLYRDLSFQDFAGKFEEHLRDWAEKNRYLINTERVHEKRGKDEKRTYFMLIDHSNLVTAEKVAAEIESKEGSFLTLPAVDQVGGIRPEITFRLNKGTFLRQKKYKDVREIVDQFVKRIRDEFEEELGITVEPSKEDQSEIVVRLDDVVRTEANAKKLIDLVDFVKTMVIALA